MITKSLHGRLMTSLLKSRLRPYSSTVSQEPAEPASLARSLFTGKIPPKTLFPGPVRGVGTPMIKKSELDMYFYPLFCRGWDIKRLPEADVNSTNPNYASPFMICKFRLKGNMSARAFVREIIRIEDEEKHHVSFNLWSEKKPLVTVMTQTHSTIKTEQGIESNGVPTDGMAPGVTLRDIRFAVKIENLLEDPNVMIDKIPEEFGDRADEWQTLLSQYPFANSN